MKKILIAIMTVVVVVGCSDGSSGITEKKSSDSSVKNNKNIGVLTITKESLLGQLSKNFPNRLCNSINGAKLNMNPEQCVKVAHNALTDCIGTNRDDLPEIIEIDKSNQSQQIINLLKPIFTCTKDKMGIPAKDKIAIRLNFEFDTVTPITKK